jgi:hypothetical protein
MLSASGPGGARAEPDAGDTLASPTRGAGADPDTGDTPASAGVASSSDTTAGFVFFEHLLFGSGSFALVVLRPPELFERRRFACLPLLRLDSNFLPTFACEATHCLYGAPCPLQIPEMRCMWCSSKARAKFWIFATLGRSGPK